MEWFPDWRISLLSLAWLVAGVGTSVGLAIAGYRSLTPERHAVAWGWLAFVSGSEAWAWVRLQAASRCFTSYGQVALVVVVGAGIGALCAVLTFGLFRSRGWGGRPSSALAGLMAALLVCLFFRSVVVFWWSDLCFPRDYYP